MKNQSTLWTTWFQINRMWHHREKICHVEKFLHMTDCNMEIFSCDKLSWIKSTPHKKYEKICNVEKWCVQFMVFCRFKINFLAIYSVLSRNFCRDLRACVWRKIVLEIVCVEKKRQISGMILSSFNITWSLFRTLVLHGICNVSVRLLKLFETLVSRQILGKVLRIN